MEHGTPTLLERTLSLVGLQKRVALDPQIPEQSGAAGAGYPLPPPFDIATSYSALARFPWIWSCAQAIMTDLSALPIRVVRVEGGKESDVDDHPFLDLIRKPIPSGRGTGLQLRQQVTLDYAIVRDAFVLTDDERKPSAMWRVHPSSCKPIVDGAYLPTAYEVGTDVVQRVPWSRVVHIRGPSWMDGAQQVYGTSPIEVLELLLNVEYDALQNARRASKRGRPDMVMSPPDSTAGAIASWTADQAKAIQRWVDNWTSSRAGVLVNPWGAKVTPVTQSLRDLEFTGVIDRGTAAQLAVMGVPPSRVQGGSANYATAGIELLIYWQNLQGYAAAIDDGFSVLAERLGRPGDRVVTDFSGVPVLQEYRKQALERVTLHIVNGMDPVEAYLAEGLLVAAERMRRSMTTATPPEEPKRYDGRRYIDAAVQHLRLVGADGIPPEDVPELVATLEAAGGER